MTPKVRVNVLVASDVQEADFLRDRFPQLKFYYPLTPDDDDLPGRLLVGRYTWTPSSLYLPPRVRLALRGVLAAGLDDTSVQHDFPGETLP